MASEEKETQMLFKSVLKYLKPLITEAKNNDFHFHSPTSDIQECCSMEALECFNSQLLHLNVSAQKSLQSKLHKDLKKNKIVSNVDTCTQEQKENVKCKPCDSYPKVNSKEFLNNLRTFLQKIYSQLAK